MVLNAAALHLMQEAGARAPCIRHSCETLRAACRQSGVSTDTGAPALPVELRAVAEPPARSVVLRTRQQHESPADTQRAESSGMGWASCLWRRAARSVLRGPWSVRGAASDNKAIELVEHIREEAHARLACPPHGRAWLATRRADAWEGGRADEGVRADDEREKCHPRHGAIGTAPL